MPDKIISHLSDNRHIFSELPRLPTNIIDPNILHLTLQLEKSNSTMTEILGPSTGDFVMIKETVTSKQKPKEKLKEKPKLNMPTRLRTFLQFKLENNNENK